jgi:hypothetical protein
MAASDQNYHLPVLLTTMGNGSRRSLLTKPGFLLIWCSVIIWNCSRIHGSYRPFVATMTMRNLVQELGREPFWFCFDLSEPGFE